MNSYGKNIEEKISSLRCLGLSPVLVVLDCSSPALLVALLLLALTPADCSNSLKKKPDHLLL